MIQIDLLKKLNETAIKTRLQKHSDTSEKIETLEQKNFRIKAEKLVQKEVTHEKMLREAKNGRMTLIVHMLNRWVRDESELSFFEKCIFEEIKKAGFTPLLCEEFEPDSTDHTDYYIGISWKNV